jgi:hypothetical protein
MTGRVAFAMVLVFCCAAAHGLAQQPMTVNARIVPRATGTDLRQTFEAILKEQADPAWVVYTVPVAGEMALRSDDWSERCRLEPAVTSGAGSNNGLAGPVKLEPSPTVMVLFRVQQHEVQKIRTYSSDCQLDAGGLTLIWLDKVSPAQSVALLRTFTADSSSNSQAESALSALARHGDPAAADVLFDLARTGTARQRQRSLFWIARRAESKAAATISDAIERDPDLEVKKQAVFALSQLPRGEGVPILINLARSATNPTVRKQAFFWLGQSKDPRALSFFEQVLR